MEQKLIEKLMPLAGQVTKFDFHRLALHCIDGSWMYFNGLYFFGNPSVLDPQPSVDDIDGVEWIPEGMSFEAFVAMKQAASQATQGQSSIPTEAFIKKATEAIGEPNESQKEALAQKIGISKETFDKVDKSDLKNQ